MAPCLQRTTTKAADGRTGKEMKHKRNKKKVNKCCALIGGACTCVYVCKCMDRISVTAVTLCHPSSSPASTSLLSSHHLSPSLLHSAFLLPHLHSSLSSGLLLKPTFPLYHLSKVLHPLHPSFLSLSVCLLCHSSDKASTMV